MLPSWSARHRLLVRKRNERCTTCTSSGGVISYRVLSVNARWIVRLHSRTVHTCSVHSTASSLISKQDDVKSTLLLTNERTVIRYLRSSIRGASFLSPPCLLASYKPHDTIVVPHSRFNSLAYKGLDTRKASSPLYCLITTKWHRSECSTEPS